MRLKRSLTLMLAAVLLLGGGLAGLTHTTQTWTVPSVAQAPNTAEETPTAETQAEGDSFQALFSQAADSLPGCVARVSPLDKTAVVPVLMYHHIDPDGDGSASITPELFRAHMSALSQAGYAALFPDDLAAYVNGEAPLPKKPVVITFDDGYLSNYQYAYPILKETGMVATIFVIGATVGNTEYYKGTNYPITPHFTFQQGAEMVASGIISIQSHTYDMHQWAPYETSDSPRVNILPLAGETEEEYRAFLSADCQKIRQAILEGTGEDKVHAMAYPSGKWNDLAQQVLLENGFDITFTTAPGCALLVKGDPQSLLGLPRYDMSRPVTVEALLNLVSPARGVPVEQDPEGEAPPAEGE